MTLSVRIPPELEQRLSELSQKARRTKTSFVCQALEEFLEDQEDYFAALEVQQRIDAGLEKTYTLEEASRILGWKNLERA
jgi:RHH-type rel operon transcriptional repressor/antitoxin RelB